MSKCWKKCSSLRSRCLPSPSQQRYLFDFWMLDWVYICIFGGGIDIDWTTRHSFSYYRILLYFSYLFGMTKNLILRYNIHRLELLCNLLHNKKLLKEFFLSNSVVYLPTTIIHICMSSVVLIQQLARIF